MLMRNILTISIWSGMNAIGFYTRAAVYVSISATNLPVLFITEGNKKKIHNTEVISEIEDERID